jgi:probable rRNA maturation factor
MHNVDVSTRGSVKGIAAKTVKLKGERALELLKDNPCNVAVVLCDDKFIHTLNRDFRHKDRPTDVLSFPYGDDIDITEMENEQMLGDIIISIETAKKQAAEKKHTLRKEVTILLVHGILHLLGYTHEEDHDEAEMESKAREILDKIK